MFCPIAHCNELRVQGTMLLFKESQIRRHINTCMVHCIAMCCILVHRNTVQQAGIGALYTCTEGCNAIWLNAKYDNAPSCNWSTVFWSTVVFMYWGVPCNLAQCKIWQCTKLQLVHCILIHCFHVLRGAMQFGSVQKTKLERSKRRRLWRLETDWTSQL